VGTNVRSLQPGDEVFGVCAGSFAKDACARAGKVVAQARQPHIRTGCGRPNLRLHRPSGPSLSHLRRALAPRGTLVLVGGEGGGRWFGGIHRQLLALTMSPLVRQQLRSLLAKARTEDLRFLKEVIEAGKVTPVIDRTYPLREAPAAIAHLEEEHARGKVVITV
jgi:threonine dehydrogenase-like Zn-dependent dehydrogenase